MTTCRNCQREIEDIGGSYWVHTDDGAHFCANSAEGVSKTAEADPVTV